MPTASHRMILAKRAASGFSTITDSFNRADSSTTLGNTDTGQTWVPLTGTWGIASNQAWTTTDADNQVVVDATIADATYQATCILASNSSGGLVFRAVDASNYLLVDLGINSSSITLYTKIAGAYTSIGSSSLSISAGVGIVVQVHCLGTAIDVYADGVNKISTTSSQFQTATKYGFRLGANTGYRWDVLSIGVA